MEYMIILVAIQNHTGGVQIGKNSKFKPIRDNERQGTHGDRDRACAKV